jgi:nucleoside phosphorylase
MDEGAPAPAPAPSPRRPIAVVAALPIELAGARRAILCRKKLALGTARAWVGIADRAAAAGPGAERRSAVAAALGMGQAAVERSLARLFAEFPPAAVVLVGLAGGCTADARPGDAIACDPMVVEPEVGPNGAPIEGRAPLGADRLALDAVLRAAGACGVRIRVAPSVTINVIAASARAKDSLGRNRGAAVCEMENFFAARFCRARGVPFAAVRVVFDAVGEPLPALAAAGDRAIWRVLWERPRLVGGIPRLALRMLRVRRTLDPLARAIVGELAAAAPD